MYRIDSIGVPKIILSGTFIFATALANMFECSVLKPFLFCITSFTKLTMFELGMIEPSKTNCPLSF